MNEIMNIKGIECYEKDGTVYLKLETVARGLGFIDSSKEVEYVRWNTVRQYLRDMGFSQEVAKEDFIPENIFYRLAMKAKNETAEKFHALVADEIIPAVRKTGSYGLAMTTGEQIQLLAKGDVELSQRVDKVEDRITSLENGELQKQRMAAPKIEIRQVDSEQGKYSEIFINDHKLHGTLGYELNPVNVGELPILTVDLNATNIYFSEYHKL